LSDSHVGVYPTEKWALFSNSPVTRKVTGNLNYNVLLTLHHEALEYFLYKKHEICAAKLKDISTDGLHALLKKSKPHQRASLAKLIHRWIPTNSFAHLQSRTQKPTCPRCLQSDETADHILVCPAKSACESRERHVYQALTELSNISTSQCILNIMEEKLCHVMRLPHRALYKNPALSSSKDAIDRATRHQNLIGWPEFLRGFISKHWIKVHRFTCNEAGDKKQPPWHTKITSIVLKLHKDIWEDRNNFVHGQTVTESKKEGERGDCSKGAGII
jgi:hypothetical protein